MTLPAFLANMQTEYLIGGIFVFLIIYSFSIPITEEIALVLVGIIAHARGLNFWIVYIASYPGIYGSDLVYYFLARQFGFRLLSSRFGRKFIKPKKVLASERYFQRKGPHISFFSRFFVGIRAPVMIAAGLLRMKFIVYAMYDGLAAVVATFFWLTAGFCFGQMLEKGLNSLCFVFSVAAPLFMIGGAILFKHLIEREERVIAEEQNQLAVRTPAFELEDKVSIM